MRTDLGVVVGVVQRELRLLNEFRDDPITRASGCADELYPLVSRACMERVEALLRARGYESYREFVVEVEDRTCAKWVSFYSGVDQLDDMAGLGFFSGDSYNPPLFEVLSGGTPELEDNWLNWLAG